MKIALLAPINNSLYSRLVTYLIVQEPNVEISMIIVRKAFNLTRVLNEFKRDGVRLVKKIFNKLILRNKAFSTKNYSLLTLSKQCDLPGKSLLDLSKKYDIPLLFVNDLNEAKVIRALKPLNLDAIIFTGGGLIRKKLLSLTKIGVINCHAGILPPYRGMDVIEWAIIEMGSQPPNIGLTLHIMDKGIDTGPILKTLAIQADSKDTLKSIRTRFEPEMVKLMVDGLRELNDGKLAPRPQPDSKGKQYFVMHNRIKAIAEKLLINIK